MEILFHDDERKVKAYSSIDQYSKFIATYERGGWTPIEFDYLDYIDCDKVVSHPVIIEFDDRIGYHFPIGECGFTTDEYLLMDKEGTELRELSECMGGGFYESYDKSKVIINFDDDSALGTHNTYRLKVGYDYFLADEFLPADDPE